MPIISALSLKEPNVGIVSIPYFSRLPCSCRTTTKEVQALLQAVSRWLMNYRFTDLLFNPLRQFNICVLFLQFQSVLRLV
jgi:hypothetical protein